MASAMPATRDLPAGDYEVAITASGRTVGYEATISSQS
jgi:hypothetical protein